MAKISTLPALDDMDGTEQIVAVRDGVTLRAPVTAVTGVAKAYTDAVGLTKLSEFDFPDDDAPGGSEKVWNAALRRIRSLLAPVQSNDAATKGYVDGNAIILFDNGSGEPVWNAALRRIRSLLDPVQPNDAATKGYVDGNAIILFDNAVDEPVWNAALHRIRSLLEPVQSNDAATKGYVDNAASDTLADAGRLRDLTAVAALPMARIVAAQPSPRGVMIPYGDGHRLWGIGIAPQDDCLFDRIEFELNGLGNADASGYRVARLRLRVYSRPRSEGDGNADVGNMVPPGGAANDRGLMDTYFATRDVVAQPCTDNLLVTCTFPLADMLEPASDPDRFYFFVLTGYDADDNLMSIGIRSYDMGAIPGGNADWKAGFYSDSFDNLTGTVPIAGPASIAYKLFGRSAMPDTALTTRPVDRQIAADAELTSPGLTIAVPAVRVGASALERIVGGVDVTLAPLPHSAVSDTVMLSTKGPAWLSHRYAAAPPIVWRGATMLIRNIHYRYDANLGTVTGLAGFDGAGGTADTAVTVSYDGVMYRVDSIHADSYTGAIGVTAGIADPRIASEWPGAPPPGSIPLFRARVSPSGVELLPIHRAARAGGYLIGEEAAHQARVARNHRALRRTIGGAMAGRAQRLAGYGDSTCAVGTNLPAQNLAPNGPARDNDIYLERYSAAQKAALLHFAGDGGAAAHIHIGPMWALKDALSLWGATVTYDNWGVGGTDSSAGSYVNLYDGATYLHMGHPDRLDSLLASDPDMVMLITGQNELGRHDSFDNVMAIGERIRSEGIEMGISAPTRPGLYQFFTNREQYLYTCGELERAADHLGAAFVATQDVFGRCEQYGYSAQDLSAATGGNHSGVVENAMLADLYRSLVPLG